ncbi:MAG TPA: hypothetical protein VFH39_02590, partial [Candidatus Saccharimonadales bacterium]|nr:hypothetical protein [Candidatus Saccharimonadales bacterium]
GCGGIIAMLGEQNVLDMDPKDVFGAIFGREAEDKYGSLHFKCRYGHSNRRPRNQLLEKCQVCKVSVRC